MFVPIILGSDKTTVSVATGHNSYWPVYMSIGNIHNNVRRAHCNGLVLLGFLAIPTSEYSPLHSIAITDQLNVFSRSRVQQGRKFLQVPPSTVTLITCQDAGVTSTWND
jgi:hypothetical protein